MAEKSGMDAVLAKLGKKLGRKPMLKRKSLTDSAPMKESGMTVMIGMGKPSEKPMRTHEGMEESSADVTDNTPKGLREQVNALMERIAALESRCDEYDGKNGGSSNEESDMEEDD